MAERWLQGSIVLVFTWLLIGGLGVPAANTTTSASTGCTAPRSISTPVARSAASSTSPAMRACSFSHGVSDRLRTIERRSGASCHRSVSKDRERLSPARRTTRVLRTPRRRTACRRVCDGGNPWHAALAIPGVGHGRRLHQHPVRGRPLLRIEACGPRARRRRRCAPLPPREGARSARLPGPAARPEAPRGLLR